MTHDTQCLQVQRHLSKGKSLTKLEALLKFGIGNLGGRIYDLRKQWRIDTNMVLKNGKRVAEYSMPRARGGR